MSTPHPGALAQCTSRTRHLIHPKYNPRDWRHPVVILSLKNGELISPTSRVGHVKLAHVHRQERNFHPIRSAAMVHRQPALIKPTLFRPMMSSKSNVLTCCALADKRSQLEIDVQLWYTSYEPIAQEVPQHHRLRTFRLRTFRII